MKIVFTKPTNRSTVPGFSKNDRFQILDIEEFDAKNLNVEFVKLETTEALKLSNIIGSVKLKTGSL